MMATSHVFTETPSLLLDEASFMLQVNIAEFLSHVQTGNLIRVEDNNSGHHMPFDMTSW